MRRPIVHWTRYLLQDIRGLYLALKLRHIERIGFNWEFFEVVALLIDVR